MALFTYFSSYDATCAHTSNLEKEPWSNMVSYHAPPTRLSVFLHYHRSALDLRCSGSCIPHRSWCIEWVKVSHVIWHVCRVYSCIWSITRVMLIPTCQTKANTHRKIRLGSMAVIRRTFLILYACKQCVLVLAPAIVSLNMVQLLWRWKESQSSLKYL